MVTNSMFLFLPRTKISNEINRLHGTGYYALEECDYFAKSIRTKERAHYDCEKFLIIWQCNICK